MMVWSVPRPYHPERFANAVFGPRAREYIATELSIRPYLRMRRRLGRCLASLSHDPVGRVHETGSHDNRTRAESRRGTTEMTNARTCWQRDEPPQRGSEAGTGR